MENWRLLSEIVESFQPLRLRASPLFTTESDAESLHSVVCPCPLVSVMHDVEFGPYDRKIVSQQFHISRGIFLQTLNIS